MRKKKALRFIIIIIVFMELPCYVFGQNAPGETSPTINMAPKSRLIRAIMCEGISENSPRNQAIVFSKTLNEVLCFTTFDSISTSTFIYHKWFYKDVLNRAIKLTINPPRWSTYSRMHIRDGDEGPWRVEISDDQENTLKILRFSIVD